MLSEKLCGLGQGDIWEEMRMFDKFGSCQQIRKI